jgi:hypothetical protein
MDPFYGLICRCLPGIKILIVCFESQLNSDWFRIARTIREMGSRQEGNGPLWRFLDFIAMYRCALYTLLLPFMHTRLHILPEDSEQEKHYLQAAKEKLSGSVIQCGRSRTLLLSDLGRELGEMRDALNKKLQGTNLEDGRLGGTSPT